MRTQLALLMMTDGNPVMHIEALAKVFGKAERTIQNRIYAKTFEVPTFQLDGKIVAHVDDVANYIDAQRAGTTAAP